MDNKTKHSDLLRFLEQHGRFVGPEFPRTALTSSEARLFLTKLRAFEILPLGIELWRRDNQGYDVAGALGWYAETEEVESAYHDAITYLDAYWLRPDDLFVVQY